MNLLAFVLVASTQVNASACSPQILALTHLEEAISLRTRVEALAAERKELLSKRSRLAKRSVKLAEMGEVKRSLAETFGASQEDLERKDLAYTARLRTIADEASTIEDEIREMKDRQSREMTICRNPVKNAQN